LASNKDTQVAGSVSAAQALFLANAIDEARRGENHLMTQYWYNLAAKAAAGGQHLYPQA
jgi:hypothetical protein